MSKVLSNWAHKINLSILFLWGTISLVASRGVYLPLFVIAGVGCFVHRFQNYRRLLQPEWVLLVLMLGWSFITINWSLDQSFALKQFTKILPVILCGGLCVLYFETLSKFQFDQLFKSWLLGLLAALIFMVLDRLLDYPLVDIVHALPAATYSRFITLLCLGIWGVFLTINRLRQKYLIVGLGLITLISFIWSYDFDAGPVSLILGTLIMLLTWVLPKFTSYLLKIGIIATPILVVLGFSFFMTQDQWQKIAAPDLHNSHQHRLEMIDWASKKITQNLLGYGIGQTRELSQSQEIPGYFIAENGNLSISSTWLDGIRHLHNGLLQILLELGIIGYALIGALILALLRKLSNFNLDRYRLGVMHGYVTSLFFIISVSFGVWQIWWLSTILVLTILYAFKLGHDK